MNVINPVVGDENGATPAATSSGSSNPGGILDKALVYFKGALIVSAVVYVTVSWALEAVARFN